MVGREPPSTAELFGLEGAEQPPARSRPRREPYFEAYWFAVGSGERGARATRAELREAYRLLSKHRDVWNGRAA
jgi:hypothetical protein